MPKKIKIKTVGYQGVPTESGVEMLKKIGQFARTRLAENIMPWNYDDIAGKKSSVKRGIESVILGKKEQEREEKEQYIEKGYGAVATDEDKLRLDLLSEYGGLKPKYGTLKQSAYRPSIEREKGVRYLDSDIIRKEIIKNLRPIRNAQDFENYVEQIYRGDVDIKDGKIVRGETGGVKAKVTGLGMANIAYGEDKKGPYISYYDVWDIDPTSGKYAQRDGMIKETLKTMGKNVLAAGSNPPEIYGRIYLDKKTGKPIL